MMFFVVEWVDATFVPMPDGVELVGPRAGGAGTGLTPAAKYLAVVQAKLVMDHPAIFPGFAGLRNWQPSPAAPLDGTYKWTSDRDFHRDGTSVLRTITADRDGKKAFVALALKPEYVNKYMSTSQIAAYPLWLVTPEGELWAPLDKRVAKLPHAIREK